METLCRSNRRQHRRSYFQTSRRGQVRAPGTIALIYLLDTNACITHLRSPAGSPISRKMAAHDPSDIVLCSIVKAELIFGVWRSLQSQKNLENVQQFFSRFGSLPFDDSAAAIYGKMRA